MQKSIAGVTYYDRTKFDDQGISRLKQILAGICNQRFEVTGTDFTLAAEAPGGITRQFIHLFGLGEDAEANLWVRLYLVVADIKENRPEIIEPLARIEEDLKTELSGQKLTVWLSLRTVTESAVGEALPGWFREFEIS